MFSMAYYYKKINEFNYLQENIYDLIMFIRIEIY